MTEQRKYFWVETDPRGEEYIRTFDEVLALPIDADGNVLFAVEAAPAFGGERVLILAGGTAEPDEPAAETANRELQEELGYRAGRLDYLGAVRPWSKYLTVQSHLFLARDLTESKLQGDEVEPVGVERIPWSQLDALIAGGRLRDARAIAAISLARLALFGSGA